jgi:hypothetical protein
VLIPILYLKGISTGDFEEALMALLGKDCAIPTIPISRSSGSRSVIPIDPDQTGVSAPLDAFADLRVCGSGQA